MTSTERDSWFNTGTLVALVFVSLAWKGATLKVRLIHAAFLFAAFLLVRFAYARFTRPPLAEIDPESKDSETGA